MHWIILINFCFVWTPQRLLNHLMNPRAISKTFENHGPPRHSVGSGSAGRPSRRPGDVPPGSCPGWPCAGSVGSRASCSHHILRCHGHPKIVGTICWEPNFTWKFFWGFVAFVNLLDWTLKHYRKKVMVVSSEVWNLSWTWKRNHGI